ncbi:MAG: exodeoxyribonuclease VII large subunit [Firmicutes bacterium]|nr:exodeoxyribonuclease VII large subunit [Bacillota bacterium]
MRALTVSQLNNYIKQIFEAEELLHNVGVVGEIDGISHRGNAVYFSLRDESATIPCVCYTVTKLKGIENGQSVSVRGTPTYWNKAGKLSFTVHHIESFGFGQLFLKFQELQAKLAAEGFFDVGKKKAIPTNVTRVGVVTSKSGAVLHDIIKVATRRNPGIDIVLYSAQVQGIGAESTISNGIEFFNTLNDSIQPVDVIIVARGGGSADDLAAFNTEKVARAVFASKIPIVSAVGHETDWTLIDFVSDLRAPTPSVAAELVVTETLSMREKVVYVWNFVKYLMLKKQEALFDKTLDKWRFSCKNIDEKLGYVTGNTIKTAGYASHSIRQKVQNMEFLVRELATVVEVNNPLALLKKGYARIFAEGMVDVDGVARLKIGDTLTVQMYNGRLTTKVEDIKHGN